MRLRPPAWPFFRPGRYEVSNRDQGVEVIDRLMAGENSAKQETILRDLCETMTYGSLCALGGLTPYPVLSAINHFPEDFAAPTRARVPA